MTGRPDPATWRTHRSGNAAVDELVSALAVEQVGETSFTGHSTSAPGWRVFGGQMLAQCVVAAAMTVAPPAVAHSMHAYFVRPGRPGVKFRFEVTTVRDGRSFAVRRVEALQDNEIVTTMITSFHHGEDGFAHQDPMPVRPSADELPGRAPFRTAGDGPAPAAAVELRTCPPRPGRAESSVWLRVTAPLPDDPLLHQALLTYLSDFTILHGAFRAHDVAHRRVHTASLDHSLWLHRRGRADQWLLYDSHSPSAASARANGQAMMFTAEGDLLATAGQEMLIRPS